LDLSKVQGLDALLVRFAQLVTVFTDIMNANCGVRNPRAVLGSKMANSLVFDA
jgi:hypothetical protein